MQTIEVCKGTVYAITSPAGCTVTNAEGNVLATVDAGIQKAVVATDAQLNVSDDTATITQVFSTSSSGIGDGGGEQLLRPDGGGGAEGCAA